MTKEEREFKKARLVIVMSASLVILAFLIGIFLGADMKPSKDLKESKVVDKKENKKKSKNKAKLRSGYEIKEVLYDTTSRGNYSIEKVELTNDGTVLVSIIENNKVLVDRLEVEKAVMNTYEVHVGISEMCEGNVRLIFDKGDDYFSYLNVDDLVCGHKITNNKITGLSNVDKIEEETEESSKDEESDAPDKYVVYAVDGNGNKTNISDKLLDEE